MVPDEDDLDTLRDVTDGALRVVAAYDRDGYEARYVRDDVEAKLGDVGDAVHRELVIQGIGREHLEDLFEAGDLHCSMHRFEEMTGFHFVDEGYTGLFVSVDSGADLPLATFSDACHDLLERDADR